LHNEVIQIRPAVEHPTADPNERNFAALSLPQKRQSRNAEQFHSFFLRDQLSGISRRLISGTLTESGQNVDDSTSRERLATIGF
jgi:hypothetical protein